MGDSAFARALTLGAAAILTGFLTTGALVESARAAPGDGPGNNGTVKIANHGDIDRIPNNRPHVGCIFDIQWYGYDKGPDIVSDVSFAMQAPTAGAGLSVSGPDRVFVGGDPATGAGTPTGFDGSATYTLSFTGAPHPKQGYHVKLTVTTPRSKGNDTKTKVFWVRQCGSPPGGGGSSTPPGGETTPPGGETTPPGGETTPPGGETTPPGGGGSTPPGGGGSSPSTGVFGSTAVAPSNSPNAGGGSAAVPTAVEAGQDQSGMPDWASSPWSLGAIAAGLALIAAGLVLRNHRSP